MFFLSIIIKMFLLFISSISTQGFTDNLLSDCQPIEDLSFCRNELVDLADTIRFTILQNPTHEDLFKVDDVDVASILEKLSEKLKENLEQCPCINTCTNIEVCQDEGFINMFHIEDAEEIDNDEDEYLSEPLIIMSSD